MNQSTIDDVWMRQALNGKFTGTDPVSNTPWQRVSVNWPAEVAPYWGTKTLAESVKEGTANLLADIKAAYQAGGGPITVLGTSAGSLVVDEAMRALATDPDAPPKSAINFVVLADTTQKLAGRDSGSIWNPFDTLSGYTYGPPPQTQFNLSVVNYEYDGWADFPDRWWNGYAVLNAIAGGFLLHAATWFVDLSTVPASDIKVVTNKANGVTTSYLIEPKTLPLVQLFPALAPMQDWLKQQIDAGYSRNDQAAASSLSSSAATAPAAVAAATPTSSSLVDASAGAVANSSADQAQATQATTSASAATNNGTEAGAAAATVGTAAATARADLQLADSALTAVGKRAAELTARKTAKSRIDALNPGLPGRGTAAVTEPARESSDKLTGLPDAGTRTPTADGVAASGGPDSAGSTSGRGGGDGAK